VDAEVSVAAVPTVVAEPLCGVAASSWPKLVESAEVPDCTSAALWYWYFEHADRYRNSSWPLYFVSR